MIDIYNDVVFAAGGTFVVSAYGNNYVNHDTISVNKITSNTPIWSDTNGRDYIVNTDSVGASQSFIVFDADETRLQSRVLQWSVTSSKPVFNISVPNAWSSDLSSLPTVAQSADGKTYAYAYTWYPNFPKTNTYEAVVKVVWNGKATNYTWSNGSAVESIWLSEDGRYLSVLLVEASIRGELVVVYDIVAAKKLFQSDAIPFADSLSFCVSPNATYIALGWSNIWVWARNSSGQYNTLLNSAPLPAFKGAAPLWFAACAVAENGNLGVAFDNFESYKQTGAALYAVTASKATNVWSWSVAPESSTYQDVVSSAAITADGAAFMYTSWGTSSSTPTARAFASVQANVTHPAPFIQLQTPGSMFWGDISNGPNNSVYLAAAGKHVHANVFGDGGDLFLVQATL